MRKTVLIGVLGLVCFSGFVAEPNAGACMNSVRLSLNEERRFVARAEQLLSGGHAREAFAMLDRRERSEGLTSSDLALTRKAFLLYAVASVRVGSGGEVEYGLDWLQKEHKKTPGDVLLTVRLAEALSRFPAKAAEALGLLEPLAKKDLIVDADGFATLARLRKQTGDETGAKGAVEACLKIAKQASVCSAEPLPEPEKRARKQVARPRGIPSVRDPLQAFE